MLYISKSIANTVEDKGKFTKNVTVLDQIPKCKTRNIK